MTREIQYPQVQAPVFTPPVIPLTFFECGSVQVFPRRWAQQPPAYAGIVMDPSLFAIPPWMGNATVMVQKFPRRWAQQPDSYAGPVMVIAAPVVTRRRWAWVS